MKRQRVGFTLVEMLFVVMVAAVIIAFAMPSFKNIRETTAERKASGYLVDLAQAKQSFERDLRMQGVANPWSKVSGNLNVNLGGSVNTSETSGKTLVDYLNEKDYSANALKNALFAYGYLQNVGTSSGYSYYIYTGANFPSNCGSLPNTVTPSVVAFMCKNGGGTSNSRAGWSYLSDGSIRAHE